MRYSALLYSTVLPLYSHSIIPRHRNALIFRRKFLQLVAESRHVIRQKFPLLILKGNFRNSETDRFQPLSASIGRFFEISSENGPGQGGEKTVRLGRNNLDL
jgi:hypothetical protein